MKTSGDSSSEDSGRTDSVDSQTRSQTGLDQRLKNMVAQRMFGGVLKEYGDGSSDGDEKPYSPASDQPEISISNTGTPKPEDGDDTDSIPTPDSGTVTPEEGASPHINMNNPILQALYRSSPDTNKTSDSVPESAVSQLRSGQPDPEDPVPDIDTEYLQGILNTVKSTTTAPLESQENVIPGPTSSSLETSVPATATSKSSNLASIKDLKITPTVTNLLGELFPQLSKSLQENKKRKQVSGEEEKAAKAPRIEETMPRTMMDVPRPHSEQVPSRPPGPPMPGLGPRPTPRGMPPARGQFFPRPPRSGPNGPFPPPPRHRGQPPSFRGMPQPPRGGSSMMSSPLRHRGPPPPLQQQQQVGRPRAPYPPGSVMVPNHTGPIPPGAYLPHAPDQFKPHSSMAGQFTPGDGSMTNSSDSFRPPPLPHPPYQGTGSFRPPRYV